MNLPNKLTVGRLVLTVLFVLAFYSPIPCPETIALILFVTAGITDTLDGRIARRRKLITNFGILMDPLVDKILICSAFIAFVGNGWMPAWMVIVIVARELAITGLRLLAASRNVVLAAESYGKHKTTSQVVAIVFILVTAGYADWGDLARTLLGFPIAGRPWSDWLAELSLWLAVLLTAMSGILYLWRNRHIYLDDL